MFGGHAVEVGGDVVDQACARRNSGVGYGGLGRIDRNPDLTGQGFYDRQDTGQFVGFAHRLGARPTGFSADIDDIGALSDQVTGIFYGLASPRELSPIGKRIGGDVHDAHDQRIHGV